MALQLLKLCCGDVSYANKFLRTPAYTAAMANGQISYGEFATDPCRSLFKRLTSLFTAAGPSANANVNITKLDEHFLALTETPMPIEFDPQTLETVGVFDYGTKIISLLLRGKPFIENFAWQPQYGTRFLVMKKAGGKVVRTYESDAFFAFHHINAFEREGDIFVDISAYADASIINQLYLARLLGPKGGAIVQGQFRRYRLPARGTTADYEILTEESIELPRIHYERANAHDYRFAYGVSRHTAQPEVAVRSITRRI